MQEVKPVIKECFASAFLIFCLCCNFSLHAEKNPEAFSGFTPQTPVYAKNYMAASANVYATLAGVEVMAKGGSAMDAAIAMQMVLNVVEPQSSGIGGGAFLLYYSKKDDKVFAFDGRETAPMGAEEDAFLDKQNQKREDALVGGQSVGVPGLLKMLEMAHSSLGKLPWQELFDPAIELAESGFPVSYRLNKLIQETNHLDTFSEARNYLFEEGKPKEIGTLLKNPALADTLKLIARDQTAIFYEGQIAQDIVASISEAHKNPGTLSLSDLKNYQAIIREPIKSTFGPYEIYGFPPPSSGGITVFQILAMLGNKNLKNYNLGSLEFINLFAGASRLAYADRDFYIADPDFFPVPVEELLNPKYLKARSEKISPSKALKNALPGLWSLKCCPNQSRGDSQELSSTSQICVVDKEGNVVSMTTSVENAFGSTLMVRGFFLNNQLTDFSISPNKRRRIRANRIEGKKRPMSSMSPTLVFKEGKCVLSLGSAGGARIIDYVAQALMGVLSFDKGIQEAISFPHYTAIKETLDLEKDTFLQSYKSLLEEMGNQVRICFMPSGSVGIEITEDALIGGVDPRREGVAIGN